MTSSTTWDRISELFARLGESGPVFHAAVFLWQGYFAHATAADRYVETGALTRARADELIEVYRVRLLARLTRLTGQTGGVN